MTYNVYIQTLTGVSFTEREWPLVGGWVGVGLGWDQMVWWLKYDTQGP